MDEGSIFAAALEKAPAERTAFLDGACAGNLELRADVESLLRAHEAAGGFLEPDQAEQATIDAPTITECPGSMIGPYKLMEQIGEGGFGLVFVARQERPLRRKVALKIIKPGMDSKEIIARFEAERQALALMEHPNIARVLDAGTTESGRPYFVMELVKGIPIVDYCDQQQLTTSERLDLFVSVCQAVQHAHSKGIIHRDLKPSNILVAPHDGIPVVKVIDFGIAKAIGQQLTEKTIYTRFSQMIGTPLYMSPEQAEVNALDVDTRSDIYSLGVLLYELLTGTTPFDRQRFATAAYDEIRRIIREEDPPKPSRRLSTLGDTLPKVSANRKTEPARLPSIVAGDLDWIVMKALEKERTRRYETATGVAADVRRYLSNEPIEARPPSATYRFQKFARRNKAVLGTTLSIFALLVVGILALGWLARDREIARNEAEQKRREAVQLANQLESSEKTLFRHRYTSDMPGALAAWERGNVQHARALLARNVPQRGLDDPRGIEWDYLTNLARIHETDKIQLTSRPKQIAMAPDERQFAVTQCDGTLLIVDAQTHKIIREIPNAVYAFLHWRSITWPPNTDNLVYQDDGHQGLVIRNLKTDISHAIPLTTPPRGVFASPKGDLLAVTLFGSSQVELRNASTGILVTTLSARGDTYACAFSPDAKRLVAADFTSPAVTVLNISTTEKLVAPIKHDAPVMAIAFSPDGKLLATGGYDHVIKIWDAITYQPLQELHGHSGAILSVAFSSASDKFVSTSRDNTVRVWNVPEFRALYVLRGHSQAVGSATFCNNGNTVISCGDLTVRFWDLDRISPIRTIRRAQQVRDVVFLDDRRLAYYELLQRQIYVLDIDTMHQELLCECGAPVHSIISLSNHRMAVGRADGKIELWDTRSRKLVHTIECDNTKRVFELQWDDSTRALAAATEEGLYVWQLRDADATLLLSRPGLNVQSICFLGNDVLAWGSEYAALGFCNYQTNTDLQRFPDAHRERITRIDYSRENHLIVTCSLDGRVRLWDSRTFVPRGEIKNTLGRQWWTCFSPDGKTLLTTGDDSYVTVWDLATRAQRFQFPKLAGAGKCLAISPSGKWLVASTLNGEIRIWDIGPSQRRH